MIPIYPYIVDNSAYTATSQEVVRQGLWNYIYTAGIPDQLMNKGYYKDQLGKDSMCYWSEMFYYFCLIEYMILLFEDIKTLGYACGTEDFNKELATFNLDCIKKTLLCRYGASGVVDSLKNALVDTMQKKLNLCCPPDEGISWMQILGNDCNVFHIYPQS